MYRSSSHTQQFTIKIVDVQVQCWLASEAQTDIIVSEWEWSLMPHPTQPRSFRRRSSQPITWQTKQYRKIHKRNTTHNTAWNQLSYLCLQLFHNSSTIDIRHARRHRLPWRHRDTQSHTSTTLNWLHHVLSVQEHILSFVFTSHVHLITIFWFTSHSRTSAEYPSWIFFQAGCPPFCSINNVNALEQFTS